MVVHGWLVLELSNDSAFWVGMYALVLGAGQFLFSPLAGALTDRFQRRNVLLVEGTLGAAIAAGLAVATYFDAVTLWMAIGLAFAVGCLRAVRFTGTNRLIYDLVGAERLVNGVALWRVSTTLMMIGGGLLAGLLIDRSGVWAAYAFLAISLFISLPFLAMIRVTGNVEKSGGDLFRQTLEGIRYAATNQSLRVLFTLSLVMETLGFAFLVMIPVMAKNVLEVGGIGLGMLQAGVGAGQLIATLVMAAKGDSLNKPRIILLNAIGAGVALIAFSQSPSLPLSILLAGVVMGLLNAYDLTLGVLLQLVAPPTMRGRAISLHSLSISFTSFGGFVMGVAGSVVGVPLILAIGGSGIVVNALLRRPAIMRIQEYGQQADAVAPDPPVDTAQSPRDNMPSA